MKKIVQRFKDLFTKDFIITVIGQVIVVVISFLVNKILSNYVSTDEFGIYNIAKRFTDVVTYIVLLAMGIAIPKYLAEYKSKNDEAGVHMYWVASLLLVFGATVIVSIIAVAARVPIMRLMFGENGYEKYVFVSLLYAFGSALATMISSYCRGVGFFYRYNFIQIAVQILYFVVVLICSSNAFLILLYSGLAYLAADFAVLIYYFIKKRKLTVKYKSPKNYLKPMKELVIYGVPRVPGEFVLFAYNLVPLIIISNKFNLTQSAYFSASLSVNATVTTAFGFIGIMLLPAVSSAIATRKFDKVDKNITFLAILYVLVSVLGIIFIYFCGEWLIKLLYSEEYIPAVTLLIITSVAILPRAMFLLLRNPIDGVTKIPFNTINLAISFAITCVGMLLVNSIQLCAWIYVIGYCALAALSFATWMFCRKKVIKKINAENGETGAESSFEAVNKENCENSENDAQDCKTVAEDNVGEGDSDKLSATQENAYGSNTENGIDN